MGTTSTTYSTNTQIPFLGIQAKAPQANLSSPSTSLPSSQTATSGLGSYKGVTINPGSDQQIQQQIASINAGQGGTNQPQTTGNSGSTGSTGSTGSGTGGGQAPAGWSYNGQGKLVPTSTLGGTNNFGTAVGTLSATAASPSQQYQTAEQAYNQAAGTVSGLIGQLNNTVNGVSNMGTNIDRAGGLEGNAQNLANNAISQQVGLENAANQQETNATAQQTAQQNGQASAATLLQPVTQYGALTSPVTGQSISSNGVVSSASSLPAAAQQSLAVLPPTAQNAIMLEAQKVMNNQETLAQAQTNLSSYSQAGVTALNAILGPSFNANTNAGASSAQQSNTSTAGTAQTNANANIYSTQLSNAAGTLQQAQAIQSSGDQLLTTMQTLGINPLQANIGNQTINQAMSQFSSPAYATFNANIANLQAKVGALLQTGEIPTTAGAAAQQIVNGNMTLAGLSAAITQINTEASQQAKSQLQTASQAFQNLSSNGSTATNTTASGANPWH